MKNLLFIPLVFLFLQTQNSLATHVAGAEIYYEYIGDSTGTPHHYEVTLILYRFTGGAGLGQTQTINVQSSCFPSNSLTVNQFTPAGATATSHGGVYIPDFNECGDSSITLDLMEAYHYREDIVLSGTCPDFTFSWQVCCRNGLIQNLENAASQNIYVESKLNSIDRPNSSPKMMSSAVKVFCAGYEMRWPQNAVESDGDSLYYRLAQPRHDPNTLVPWALGYSNYRPMTTAGGIYFNTSNGDFIFTPAGPETGAIKVMVEEYTLDTTTQEFYLIGTTERDLQYMVTQTCNAAVTQVNLNSPGFSGNQITELQCSEEFIRLNTSARVACNSIAPDGSDFAVFNSLGNLVPLVAAGTDSCRGEFSNSLWLEFHEPISYNDTLTLVSRLANDLNTLMNACGFSMSENDSMQFYVETCTTDVGLSNPEVPTFSVYPNPASEELNVDYLNASGSRELIILNLGGQLLKQLEVPLRKNKVDISDLPKGVYLIQSKEGGSIESTTFQKL